MEWINKIHCGDALTLLKQLPGEFVDCFITSPPYWLLRDYQTDPLVRDGDNSCEHEWKKVIKKPAGGMPGTTTTVGANKKATANMRDHNVESNFCSKCNAWRGSLGLEPSFNLYIKHLCDIFDEVKRVLKPSGTCWVNMGDTYGTTSEGMEQLKKMGKDTSQYGSIPYADGYEGVNKSAKKNLNMKKCLLQIPSRFAIEMVNRGWTLRNRIIWHKPNCMPSSVKDRFTVDYEDLLFFVRSKKYYFEQQFEPHQWADRDKRSQRHWSENKAKSGKMTKERYAMGQVSYGSLGRNTRCIWTISTKPYEGAHFATFPEELCITPIKAGCPPGGIVLDPFSGAGTALMCAKKLGRKYIGIEMNLDYCKMAEDRIRNEVGTII